MDQLTVSTLLEIFSSSPLKMVFMSLLGIPVLIFLLKDTKYLGRLLFVLDSVKTFVEDLFLFTFTASWVILLGAPYGVLLTWRALVWTYLKLRYGHLGDLVSGLDVIGTIDTDNSRQIIKSLKVLEGKCDLEDLRKKCEATVGRRHPNGRHVYPKFYQILSRCGGYFCWRPSDFDIKHHVRFCDGLDENSPPVRESEAMEICGQISNREFAKGRANWEILSIPKFKYDGEGEDGPEKTAIIIRIHHGIGDGYSLMKLIMRDMAGESEVIIPVKKSERSWLMGIFVFCYIFFKGPRAFYHEMSVRDQNDLHNDKVAANGEKSMTWSPRISLPFLKETKNKLNSGMSTIMLSALSGAIRRYIKEEFGSSVPKEVSAVIPVPAPAHPDNAMVNKFSIILFPLSTEPDPVERSRAIDKAGRVVARSPDAVMNLFLMQLAGVLPIIFSRPFVTNHQATVVVSNIPGPHKPIAIWGKKLVDTMFWLPHLGTSGISISFLSYETHLRIGLTVDSGVIPDGSLGAKRLIEGMVEELFDMAKSVGISTDGVIHLPYPAVNPEDDTDSSPSTKASSTQGAPASEQPASLEEEEEGEGEQVEGDEEQTSNEHLPSSDLKSQEHVPDHNNNSSSSNKNNNDKDKSKKKSTSGDEDESSSLPLETKSPDYVQKTVLENKYFTRLASRE